MSDFFSGLERIRATALEDMEELMEGSLLAYHYKSGLALDLLSVIQCEAAALIYKKYRGEGNASNILRWIADEIESREMQNNENADDETIYE